MRRRHSRFTQAGTVHFITTVTRVRGNWFVTGEVCTEILKLFEQYRTKFDVHCMGYVLMPDHLHALLWHETEGPFISRLMNSFKRETSKQVQIAGFPETTLWRDRYDDVPIPGSDAINRRIEYMRFNPVTRGLVENTKEYLWSSTRFGYGLDESPIVKITIPKL